MDVEVFCVVRCLLDVSGAFQVLCYENPLYYFVRIFRSFFIPSKINPSLSVLTSHLHILLTFLVLLHDLLAFLIHFSNLDVFPSLDIIPFSQTMLIRIAIYRIVDYCFPTFEINKFIRDQIFRKVFFENPNLNHSAQTIRMPHIQKHITMKS